MNSRRILPAGTPKQENLRTLNPKSLRLALPMKPFGSCGFRVGFRVYVPFFGPLGIGGSKQPTSPLDPFSRVNMKFIIARMRNTS